MPIRPAKSAHLTYENCPSNLQKVPIRPTKSAHPTYINCPSDLQKSARPTYMYLYPAALYNICVRQVCCRLDVAIGRVCSIADVAIGRMVRIADQHHHFMNKDCLLKRERRLENFQWKFVINLFNKFWYLSSIYIFRERIIPPSTKKKNFSWNFQNVVCFLILSKLPEKCLSMTYNYYI